MDVDVNAYQTLKLFGAPHVGVGSAGFAGRGQTVLLVRVRQRPHRRRATDVVIR